MTDTTAKPVATITRQTYSIGRSAGGQPEEGYKVEFQTAGGVAGQVFVPLSQYTADGVNAAVKAQATVLDSVQGMPVV